MEVIKYIDSYLNTELPLERKRLLASRGKKAILGESVPPQIEITKDGRLDFTEKALAQIKVSMKAKKIDTIDESRTSSSKYKAKIT